MMTKKQLISHLVEYMLLLLVLTIGFGVIRFVPDVFWKIILVFSIGAFYFGYGSYHHFGEKSLKLSTVLEYSLISTIIIIALLVIVG